MAFKDLRELLDDQTLQLPIGGVVYTIQACTAEDWLWLNTRSREMYKQIRDDATTGEMKTDVEGDDPEVFFRHCLGDDTFDEMVENTVTSKELQVAALTAFFWHLGNEQFAELIWVNAGKALTDSAALTEAVKKELAPNRAARRATSSPSRTSRATAASPRAKTTRASSQRTA